MAGNKFGKWSGNFHKFLYDYKNDEKFVDGDTIKHCKEMQKELRLVFDTMWNHGDYKELGIKAMKRARALAMSMMKKDEDFVLDTAFKLGVEKNHDYGVDNMLSYGVVLVIVRINDKLVRIENLHGKDAKVVNEKVEDTLLDIINYATYGIMLLNDVWA